MHKVHTLKAHKAHTLTLSLPLFSSLPLCSPVRVPPSPSPSPRYDPKEGLVAPMFQYAGGGFSNPSVDGDTTEGLVYINNVKGLWRGVANVIQPTL